MLFRPDDSRPLDLVEEDEWDDMQLMGRRRYIVNRTGSVLTYLISGIAFPLLLAWWLAPQSRRYDDGPFVWIPLAIGVALVGSLAAAHAWDTWRSYEKRALIEDNATSTVPVDQLMSTAGRHSRRGALLSTLAVGVMLLAHPPVWVIAVMGGACLLSWRSVILQRRSRHLLKPRQ